MSTRTDGAPVPADFESCITKTGLRRHYRRKKSATTLCLREAQAVPDGMDAWYRSAHLCRACEDRYNGLIEMGARVIESIEREERARARVQERRHAGS